MRWEKETASSLSLSRMQNTTISLALLSLSCRFEVLQHVGVDLLLQAVGPLVQLPHKAKLALQLQRHFRYTCRLPECGFDERWKRRKRVGTSDANTHSLCSFAGSWPLQSLSHTAKHATAKTPEEGGEDAQLKLALVCTRLRKERANDRA